MRRDDNMRMAVFLLLSWDLTGGLRLPQAPPGSTTAAELVAYHARHHTRAG